jgi:hypothetical protein
MGMGETLEAMRIQRPALASRWHVLDSNLLEFFVKDEVDSRGFFAQMAQLAVFRAGQPPISRDENIASGSSTMVFMPYAPFSVGAGQEDH